MISLTYLSLADKFSSNKSVTKRTLFEEIGWDDLIDDTAYDNTCAIRLSLALIKCNVPISGRIAIRSGLHKGKLIGDKSRQWQEAGCPDGIEARHLPSPTFAFFRTKRDALPERYREAGSQLPAISATGAQRSASMSTAQAKTELTSYIQSNRHEIFVLSIEEMDAIVRSSPRASNPTVQKDWQQIRGKIGVGASYYASADDSVKLAKLVADLGSIGAQAYVRTYGGRPHIILKGYPGLRRILTGTRYGIKNPKVVAMGLGRTGAISAAKSGGLISIVLLTSYRIIDYVLTDQATLSRLVGTLATDVVKVGISAGASIAAAIVAGGFTLAIGPLLAVVIVGVAASTGLEMLDQKYRLTERVVAALDELGDGATSYLDQQTAAIADLARKSAGNLINYAIGSARQTAIDVARNLLTEFLKPIPTLSP